MLLDQPFFLQAVGGNEGTLNFIFLGAMMLVFWFFLIRPQSKKQKEQKVFTESLQKGDNVVTSSGILGKITKVEDDIITLEIANKVYVRVTRGAISKEMTETVHVPA